MATTYTMTDLLDFLDHAGDKGLMPAATAGALAVATRNVLAVLDESEREDLGSVDLDAVVKRFTNKRARDFSPASLKEYGRRVHRAVTLYLGWRDDLANFTVKTRANPKSGKQDRPTSRETTRGVADHADPLRGAGPASARREDGTGYRSAFPIRPGVVVTLSNIPEDLTVVEAERLARFVRILAIDSGT